MQAICLDTAQSISPQLQTSQEAVKEVLSTRVSWAGDHMSRVGVLFCQKLTVQAQWTMIRAAQTAAHTAHSGSAGFLHSAHQL